MDAYRGPGSIAAAAADTGRYNLVKIRVNGAMATQAEIEARFLGGRPPFGYMIIDVGPHPKPAAAADGKRLHALAPDPQTAPPLALVSMMQTVC